MASIVKRINQDGKGVYFVRIRRKGSPTQIATFPRLADAKKWAQITETAILEGRHFPTTEAKRHPVHDLLERYRNDVLPHKRSSTIYNQVGSVIQVALIGFRGLMLPRCPRSIIHF